jgi:hypothetical protein
MNVGRLAGVLSSRLSEESPVKATAIPEMGADPQMGRAIKRRRRHAGTGSSVCDV